MNPTQLKAAIEAILYVAEEPVTPDQLRATFTGRTDEEIETALADLLAEYEAPERGIILRQVGGGYRLSTRVDYHDSVRNFLKTKPGYRLSMAALETLAIIAYKQPVTVPEILEIRGVKSSGAIRTLLEKRLITPRGRKKALGAPMQYGTSKEFLIHFGLSSLKDLPSVEEFEEIFGDKAERTHQKNLFDTKYNGIAALQRGDEGRDDGSED